MKRTIIDASQFELNDRVVAIKRVSKTVKGGRTMRFSALVVVGDGNGHVGAGLGKAAEVPEAIRKGKEAAIKNMVAIPMDENNSIPHDFLGEFGSASVLLKRAPEGTGIIAGGPVRSVVELAGIKNIRTKSLGSNNKTNVVKATFEGLRSLRTAEEIAANKNERKDSDGLLANWMLTADSYKWLEYFDASKNNFRGEEQVVSADDSKVIAIVVPTDEEMMIARDTYELCK